MARLCVLSLVGPTTRLSGHLQRFFHEVGTNLFVGKLSAKIIDSLWKDVCENSKEAVFVSTSDNESGFVVQTHGPVNRIPFDNYGVEFIECKINDNKLSKSL